MISKSESDSANSDQRTTLVINLCALFLAPFITAEIMFLFHRQMGYYRGPDIWGMFVPVIVMFLIRNKWFSLTFMTMLLFVFSRFSYEIFQIRGVTKIREHLDVSFIGSAVFLISMISAVIWAAVFVLRLAKYAINPKGDQMASGVIAEADHIEIVNED
jgi:hypothetical protein